VRHPGTSNEEEIRMRDDEAIDGQLEDTEEMLDDEQIDGVIGGTTYLPPVHPGPTLTYEPGSGS
jgi:hypothetical protein